MNPKLYLYFTNEDGEPTTLVVQQPHQTLGVADIQTFMASVIEMKLFRHKGQMKYAVAKGAKYIDKKVVKLF